MRRIIIFSLICFAIVNRVFAQGDSPTVKFDATPSVAALAKYVDTPVSYYTGTPNIKIPIYNINTGGFNFPIDLSYHASGIKVAQESSNVGLGWSLNASGMITRQIRGLDDFKSSPQPGYFNNYDYYNENLNYIKIDELVSCPLLDDSGCKLKRDLEPDLFMYNFGAYSGKFILRRDAKNVSTGTGILIDQENNLLIKYNSTSFRITAPNGIQYVFSTNEKSRTVSISKASPFSSPPLLFDDNTSSPLKIDSWLLDEIILPNGKKIEFNYIKQVNPATSQIKVFETYDKLTDVKLNPICNTLTAVKRNYTYFRTYNDIYTLNSIIWDNGEIKFNQSIRKDYASTSIANIQISNSKGDYIKGFDFNYDYFNKSFLNANQYKQKEYLRLKLKEVKEVNYTTFNYLPPYKFSYYEYQPLPSKNSNSYDFWGYCNQSNPFFASTRIPTTTFTNKTTEETYKGANRKPNILKAKLGTLKSIQYPSSGIVNYDYELNTYFSGINENPDLITYQTLAKTVQSYFGYDNPFVPHEDEGPNYSDFTVPHIVNGGIELSIDSEYSDYFHFIELAIFELNEDGTEQGKDEYGILRGVVAKLSAYSLSDEEWLGFHGDRKTIEMAFNNIQLLPEKKYRLRFMDGITMASQTRLYGNMNINKINYGNISSNINTKNFAGGLRIKKISSPKNIRIYEYEEYNEEHDKNVSSGVLLSTPNFKTVYTDQEICVLPRGSSSSSTYKYQRLQSDSNYPITGVTGKNVGYSSVTEKIVDEINKQEIRTVYNYHNLKESTNGWNSPNNYSPYNGKLKTILEYDGRYKRNETSYNYIDTATGFLMAAGFSSPTGHYDPEYIYTYEILLHGIVMQEKTSKLYDRRYSNSIITKEYYEYLDDPYTSIKHKMPLSKKISKSDGDNIIEKYYYPEDVVLLTNTSPSEVTATNSLIEQYRIHDVLQTDYYLQSGSNGEEKLLNSSRLSYKIENGLIVPEFFKKGKSGNLESKVEFKRYDDLGNILETINLDSGTHTSYIWSYNKTYPIAKIENATYQQVANALNKTINELSNFSIADINSLKTLRTSESLKDAMITTYTYSELIGITSITDTNGLTMTYNYDDFNRLEFITDNEGNLLSKNEYYYKN